MTERGLLLILPGLLLLVALDGVAGWAGHIALGRLLLDVLHWLAFWR